MQPLVDLALKVLIVQVLVLQNVFRVFIYRIYYINVELELLISYQQLF